MILMTMILLIVGCKKEPSDPETKATNWYVRLVAEAPQRGLKTFSSQLGQVDEENATTRYSLSYLEPLAPYIDIKFNDPEGLQEGDYKAYIQQYHEGSEAFWRFEVKSDDPNADILLSWRGLYVLTPYTDQQGKHRYKEYVSRSNPLLKFMRIVDEEDGTIYNIIDDNIISTITFNMDGNYVKTFRWELLQEEVVQSSARRSSVMASRKMKREESSSKASFDMFSPPFLQLDRQ